MNSLVIFALFSIFAITSAQLFGGLGGGLGGGGHPIRDMLFARLMQHLPASAQGQAQQIHQDSKMGPLEKAMAFHGMIESLPVDQRPIPPFVDRLPEPFKSKFMAIHNNDSLGMFDKMRAVKNLLTSMPESVKSQLPGGGRLLERLGNGGPFAELFGH